MDQYADPDGFMVQLGAILEQYPDEVVMYVSSPLTGVQRRSKWPPAISEIVEACDDHADLIERRKKPKREPLARLPEYLIKDRPAGALANVFVPDTHHRYGGLVEWAKDAEPQYWQYGLSSDGRKGIWVNISVWEQPPAKKVKPKQEIVESPERSPHRGG